MRARAARGSATARLPRWATGRARGRASSLTRRVVEDDVGLLRELTERAGHLQVAEVEVEERAVGRRTDDLDELRRSTLQVLLERVRALALVVGEPRHLGRDLVGVGDRQ